MKGDARHALAKFFAQLSYFDIDGSLLHNWEEPPTLIVMPIAPSPLVGAGSAVYEKLGIGEIYLKRWVEASPTSNRSFWHDLHAIRKAYADI
jgi:hypothetical protein